MILSMAAGEVTEDALAQWLTDNIVPLDAPGIAP